MTIVSYPETATHRASWIAGIQESVTDPLTDPKSDGVAWSDPAFTPNMEIVVIDDPNNPKARADLIGLKGRFLYAITTSRNEKLYQFALDNGEHVTSHDIWWKRC